ncbi:MAG: hypothetical protein IKE16_06195 [Solobacterium sp.]|nr:hypothetical protein [Solobacterium sp.]
MNILLFGIPCVGKNTIGRKLAELMNLPFFNQQEEMEQLKGKTAFELSRSTYGDGYDRYKREAMEHIFKTHPEDKVIAVQPLYYYTMVRPFVLRPDTFSIVLEDSPEHIFERVIIVDQDNNPVDRPEWKTAHKSYLIREIKKDITYYNNVHKHIERKFNVNNDSPEEAALRLKERIEEEIGGPKETEAEIRLELGI